MFSIELHVAVLCEPSQKTDAVDGKLELGNSPDEHGAERLGVGEPLENVGNTLALVTTKK